MTWVGWMVWVPLFDCSASPGDGNAQAVHVFFNPCFLHGLDVNKPFFGSKNAMYDNFGRIFAARIVHCLKVWIG